MGTMDYKGVKHLPLFYGRHLSAADMQGIADYFRTMRWLHNSSFHRPGIGSGFAVKGNIGDRNVSIEPGYAIDSRGREIILTRSKVLPVPPVSGDSGQPAYFDLTVSYPESDLEQVEMRQGVCYSGGTVRLREEPNFCWIKSNLAERSGLTPDSDDLSREIRDGLRIIIGRVEILECKLSKNISVAQRQNARPAQGAKIITGSYVPDPNKIEWRLWRIEFGESEVFGLKASVDTSSAGFSIPPHYHADIVGRRYVDESIDKYAINNEYINKYLLEGFSNPVPQQDGKPLTEGFDLCFLMPVMYTTWTNYDINPTFFFGAISNYPQYDDSYRQTILHNLGWYIKWVAVEG